MEVTAENLVQARSKLSLWQCLPPQFRNDEEWTGLSIALLKLSGDWEQADWLVNKVMMCCPRKPTPVEMRRLFTSGAFPPSNRPGSKGPFKPADGLESYDLDVSDEMEDRKGGPRR